MKNRKEVTWFAQQMEAQLRENDHKGHWEGCRISALYPRLQDEKEEILLALAPMSLDTINETVTAEQVAQVVAECADLANFAMMIADIVNQKYVAATRAVAAQPPPYQGHGRAPAHVRDHDGHR